LDACAGLTKLLLWSCCVYGSPHASSSADSNPLTQLSVLSSLQHLGLAVLGPKHAATVSEFIVLDLPSSLLSQLVQLTYLQLGICQVQSDAALQHLSALSALQHLDLGEGLGLGLQRPTAAALTGLQYLQQLTALRLLAAPWAINLHSMPAITVLTALRELLLLGSPSVDPAVLAGFSQLQELELCFQSFWGAGSQSFWGAEDSAAVLAAIGRQQELRKLTVSQQIHCWTPPSAAEHSALTASNRLQHLQLLNLELPVGAWRQMFPLGRCLCELRCLCLRSRDCPQQQLGLADLQAMATCCPALVTLDLGHQLGIATAAPLQQLTGLTALTVCAPFYDTAPSIAQLTGLQRLSLCVREAGDRVTVSGLLQLNVLQRRQYIQVGGTTLDPGLDTSAAECYLTVMNKVSGSAGQLGC